MSTKHLHKSNDTMIAGVCGGVAEYFDIDPTLVRILCLVLVVVGFGTPIILYIIGMILMPPDPAAKQGYVDAEAKAKPAPCAVPFSYTSEPSGENNAASPTGEPVHTGNTGSFASAAVAGDTTQPPPPNPAERVTGAVTGAVKQHWSGAIVLGAVLVGVGVLILLANFVNLSIWRFWPVILMIAGLIQLFTPSSKGWSLERAGSAIVLIAIGLALLAWMLQVVFSSAFVLCFLNLWPVLLVVAGLAIIGNAKKISAFNLAGSLLFSATLIFGLWFYSGSPDPIVITLHDGRDITLSVPNPIADVESENWPFLPMLD